MRCFYVGTVSHTKVTDINTHTTQVPTPAPYTPFFERKQWWNISNGLVFFVTIARGGGDFED